jgi:hypothetical protein
LATLMAVAGVPASAQVLDLTGQFQCVQNCADGFAGQLASISQDGWDLRLVNEIGLPSRAWIDHPGHIWVQSWDEGGIYSPDGMTIQFDRGTVWQRVLVEVVPTGPPIGVPPGYVPAPLRRGAVPVQRIPTAVNVFDGRWRVVILTRSGPCGPQYDFAVRISNGTIVNEGGEPANLLGSVGPNGAVQVSVSSPAGQATGEGGMSPTSGAGTWHGEGGAGSCDGEWQAIRRG